MKATAKPTRGKTAAKTAKYYEAKIELLEEENEILRNALEELKSELETAKRNEERAEEDRDIAWEEYHNLEKAYITARVLVNIPETLKELVFELIKTRFLLWDQYLPNAAKETYEQDPESTGFLKILPPAEILRKSKGKGKK